MKKLNLGCWNKPLKWYINLDLLKLKWVDITHNMEKFPYPFKDNTFDKIFAEHNFEHILEIEKLMREIFRISKNWALVKIKVPYYTCNSSFADPTHKRFFAWIFPGSEIHYLLKVKK